MIFTAVPLVTKTLTNPPESKQYEFAKGAQIRVTTPEKIQLEPERWPISEEIEAIEEKPAELSPESSVEEGPDEEAAAN